MSKETWYRHQKSPDEAIGIWSKRLPEGDGCAKNTSVARREISPVWLPVSQVFGLGQARARYLRVVIKSFRGKGGGLHCLKVDGMEGICIRAKEMMS